MPRKTKEERATERAERQAEQERALEKRDRALDVINVALEERWAATAEAFEKPIARVSVNEAALLVAVADKLSQRYPFLKFSITFAGNERLLVGAPRPYDGSSRILDYVRPSFESWVNAACTDLQNGCVRATDLDRLCRTPYPDFAVVQAYATGFMDAMPSALDMDRARRMERERARHFALVSSGSSGFFFER